MESQHYERQAVSPDFDEIYREIAPSVYRYLRRLTGSRAHAEDILQETFMKLHGQLTTGVTVSHPRAWLFQVATNQRRSRGEYYSRRFRVARLLLPQRLGRRSA